MNLCCLILFLAAALLPSVDGSKPSLPFELVGAYYAYKVEIQAFGHNNPNHPQEFAPGCTTQRPGASICSLDEFIKHVMPNLGSTFVPGGNWGGTDPENPDVRTVGTRFQQTNAWSINYADIDINRMHSTASASVQTKVQNNGGYKTGLKDYTDAYEGTMHACRTTLSSPAGRNVAITQQNADFVKCRSAFADAVVMRRKDAANHFFSNLDGYDWEVSVAGRNQRYTMHLQNGPAINAPDGSGIFHEVDWGNVRGFLPNTLLGHWRNFHQDLVRGRLDAVNRNTKNVNGMSYLT